MNTLEELLERVSEFLREEYPEGLDTSLTLHGIACGEYGISDRFREWMDKKGYLEKCPYCQKK